jgi:hypothetical protein
MPTEVISPITRKGSKVSGNVPCSSPGARSMPRADRRRDNAEPEPPFHGRSGGHVRSSEEPGPSLPPHGRGHEPEPSLQHAQEPDQPETLRRDEEPTRDEPARGDAMSAQQSMLDYYLQRSLGAAHIKIGGEDY